jgi:hypothetical protein
MERFYLSQFRGLAVLALVSGVAVAQNVQGVINGRSGATKTLRTRFPEMIVELSSDGVVSKEEHE